MQIIFFKDLAFPALQVIADLTDAYTKLRDAAIKENDLWTYASADMTLATLETAPYMLNQPQCYGIDACYFRSEPTDTVKELMQKRMSYVFNSAFA